MDVFEGPGANNNCSSDGSEFWKPTSKDTQVQLVISLTLGLSAFIAFCTLRPRWKTLYSARRRHLDPAIGLPILPDTFLGWVPALYKVTQEQVLASAGLDAFVFLAFFKMASQLFAVMFFFAAVVLEPINQHFIPKNGNRKSSSPLSKLFMLSDLGATSANIEYGYLFDNPPADPDDDHDDTSFEWALGYLWSYLVFTYFFTFLTVYFMNRQTFNIIRVRQHYLGTQSTITDRTFRLSGIPKELRTEAKIKELVENLEIGAVDSVTVCRKWKELDDLMDQRSTVLQKLEETWSTFLHQTPAQSGDDSSGTNNTERREQPIDIIDEEAGENSGLMLGHDTTQIVERERPQTRIWYGFLRLQSRKTDAIDYYEEKLRRLDEKIQAARKKDYIAADLAFVTMDSIAACQMAIQALIDPRPGQLLTQPAPAPSDIVWRNTYASRFSSKVRPWVVTVFVAVLSIVWLIPVAFIASLLSLCTIQKAFPALADFLSENETTKALFQTGLPTAVVSLLNVAVPYLYEFLSHRQGMLSQGDIALSIIGKNFFFTFFNIFLVFTVFGTATSFWPVLRDSLKDSTYIAYTLARSIQDLTVFYSNFIMLQGIGLFPFRLLDFGSVALYPAARFTAKTPRDFDQIIKPPTFSYGFYLPTAMLVFILCLVYSVMPKGYLVLLLGLIYFLLGYFTYKYQLLYAMDQPQHATGGAWPMICYRIILGLLVFQLTMSGVLALQSAFFEALVIVPLIIATMWYSYYFKRQFEPLTRFISLRSIKRDEDAGYGTPPEHGPTSPPPGLRRRGSTVDEDREKGLRFVNPSLIVRLEQPWIYEDPPAPISESVSRDEEASSSGGELEAAVPYTAGTASRVDSAASSVSLGDTHIWRDA